MPVTVREILTLLDGIAPFETAEPWDNVGLLAGSRNQPVATILCGLDLTETLIDRALKVGAQMIVTHHPILFRGRKNLCEDDAEGRVLCRLVRSGLAFAAMHTNFDNRHPGVNDRLAEVLGLTNVVGAENGMCIGDLKPMSLADFREHVQNALHDVVRVYGPLDRVIRKVAVLGGAGEDFAAQALSLGAEAYVTGEMAYHKGMSIADEGLCILEAGHEATEKPSISLLAHALQKAADAVQYNVCVLNETEV